MLWRYQPHFPIRCSFLCARTYHARPRAITLQDAVGLLVALAWRAIGAEALCARSAAGLLVAHETRLARTTLEGALRACRGQSAQVADNSRPPPPRLSILPVSCRALPGC